MIDNDQLYSIGQAAEICDVSRRTLRFYEIKGLISSVVFHQKMTKIGVFCMFLILAACVIIHLFGSM